MSYVAIGKIPDAGALQRGFDKALSVGVQLPAPNPKPTLVPFDPPKIIETKAPELHVKQEELDITKIAAKFPVATTGALFALLWFLKGR